MYTDSRLFSYAVENFLCLSAHAQARYTVVCLCVWDLLLECVLIDSAFNDKSI